MLSIPKIGRKKEKKNEEDNSNPRSSMMGHKSLFPSHTFGPFNGLCIYYRKKDNPSGQVLVYIHIKKSQKEIFICHDSSDMVCHA